MTTPRKQGKRGFRVVLWFTAVFVFAQVGGGLLLDYRWPQIRFPGAFRQFESFAKLPRSPDILCLGSSRIQSSLLDADMTQALRQHTGDTQLVAYNANVPGGDLITSEYVFAELWQRGARPRLVVLEVVPEEVNHLNDWLKLHVLRQIRWDDLPRYAGEVCRTGHVLRLLESRLVPLYTHRYQLLKSTGATLRDWVIPAETAAAEKPPEPARDLKDLLAKKQRPSADQVGETQAGLNGVQRGLRRYHPGGNSAQALERLLAFCKEKNVAVVLLGVPVSQPHRQLYTPAIEAEFQAYLQHIELTYGCHFADCRGALPDWLFRDNHHATSRGGQYFSQRFADEVLAPAWGKIKS